MGKTEKSGGLGPELQRPSKLDFDLTEQHCAKTTNVSTCLMKNNHSMLARYEAFICF